MKVFLSIIFLLILSELTLKLVDKNYWLSDVDIQSKEIFVKKLDDIKPNDVILLGDSVVRGEALQKIFGDDWKIYSLDTLLEKKHKNFRFINMGINGALPCDMNEMIHYLVPKVNYIILDLSLRSLSRDFFDDNKRISRQWVKGLNQKYTFVDKIKGSVELFKSRDFLLAKIFNSTFKDFLRRLNQTFLRSEESEDLVIQLIKSKARFKQFTLKDNPQMECVIQGLRRLSQANINTILFITEINPQFRSEIIDDATLNESMSKISEELGKIQGVEIIVPGAALKSEHFIDQIHLTDEGLQIISDKIAERISSLWY